MDENCRLWMDNMREDISIKFSIIIWVKNEFYKNHLI